MHLLLHVNVFYYRSFARVCVACNVQKRTDCGCSVSLFASDDADVPRCRRSQIDSEQILTISYSLESAHYRAVDTRYPDTPAYDIRPYVSFGTDLGTAPLAHNSPTLVLDYRLLCVIVRSISLKVPCSVCVGIVLC